MREIKFRGKKLNNKWTYGTYAEIDTTDYRVGSKDVPVIIEKNSHYESNEGICGFDIVVKETVGQFTGLYDKNGKEIYEGDIIETGYKEVFKIEFRLSEDIGCNGGEYGFDITGFMPVTLKGSVDNRGDCEIAYQSFIDGSCVVIGNIHDNPELLKEQ